MLTIIFRVFLFLCIVVHITNAFKWNLKDNIPGDEILTFSERYMFADKDGPALLPNGASYILVDGIVIQTY